MTPVTLFAPKVRYTSTFESQFDAMTTWRAELEMAYLVDDDTPDVVAGFAEFVIIRVGEHPIADLLDSLSEDAAEFSGLFDGAEVGDAVQEQFDDAPFNRVLIVTMVHVGVPVRGHDLGAWLVAEVIATMASPTDTLVLLQPYPADPMPGPDSERAAVAALSRHWQRAGLTPIDGHREFLGQATAYSYLPRARAALSEVGHVELVVPASQIFEEQPDAYRRHTVIDESGPRGLRVVRD